MDIEKTGLEKDVYVFQHAGWVSAEKDGQHTRETLLGWLDEHFTKPNR
jgi:hypothetical protein